MAASRDKKDIVTVLIVSRDPDKAFNKIGEEGINAIYMEQALKGPVKVTKRPGIKPHTQPIEKYLCDFLVISFTDGELRNNLRRADIIITDNVDMQKNLTAQNKKKPLYPSYAAITNIHKFGGNYTEASLALLPGVVAEKKRRESEMDFSSEEFDDEKDKASMRLFSDKPSKVDSSSEDSASEKWSDDEDDIKLLKKKR